MFPCVNKDQIHVAFIFMLSLVPFLMDYFALLMLLASNTEQRERCESVFTRFQIFSNTIDLSSYNIHSLEQR